MSKKVCIIGGGAAGMIAAIIATRQGKKVRIIDHKDKLGKKILATGNGKCNFTNMYVDNTCFRGEDIDYIMDIYSQFDNEKAIEFFKELGIYPKIKNGYVYPNSGQASSVLEVLTTELNYLGVKIEYETVVEKIEKTDNQFTIITNKGNYTATSLIIATGSKASPKTGSDGSGYKLAKDLGHSINPILPALVQLKSDAKFLKEVAGVRCDGVVKLMHERECIASDKGELMLTDYGISGIPVFQVSRYASVLLNQGKKVTARLDFLPNMEFKECKEYLKERAKLYPDKTVLDNLVGLLNKKLLIALFKLAKISPDTKSYELNDKQILKLTDTFKSLSINITATNSFDNAQIACGGVKLSELKKHTLESEKQKGLFFAGEILDVDGICGGYNLQWAWSSGYVCGINC